MKKPRLLMTDVDGTLMPKGDQISDRTREMLSRLHKAGIWFCIASGRAIHDVKMSIDDYQLDFVPEFIVGMNGGEIEDTMDGEFVRQYLMEPETIQEIVDKMKDQPCNISQYRGDNLYAVSWDEIVEYSAMRSNKIPHIVERLDELWEEPNAKLMLRTEDEETCTRLRDYAQTLDIPGVRFFKTQTNLLEVCDERVHKAAALEWICRKYGIEYDEVIAAGDASNDNEMIERAGTGLVLKGGLPDTLALADAVTEETCENDGLPKWIYAHLGEYL